MKKIASILLLYLLASPLFASEIKGKIVDAATNQPLDFATVAIFKQNDEAPLAGVSTDRNGNFSIPPVSDGKYVLRVSFVGYNTLNLPVLVAGKELNAGTLKLTESTKHLSEVQILGQGTQMRFEVDKKVFSVDQNIASAGGSATEVLQNIPSVNVDNEGNVSLRNSTNVEVWINGKPSGLTADNRAQVLQQMPAESIQEVEIMTNPSAKFNPEGTSGIINLVLKKNRKAGYYGSLSAGILYADGAKPGGSLGANINYSSSKIDAYLNIGTRAMNFDGKGNRHELNGTDTVSQLDQDYNMGRGFKGLFSRAGIDYHINDKHTLGLSGFGMFGSGYSVNDINYSSKNLVTGVERNYSRHNTGSGNRPSMNISLDHKYEIDKLGSNLVSSLSYSHHNRTNTETYVQTENAARTSDITQTTSGQNNELQLKVDYTKKFSANTRLEAGWQSTIQRRESPSSGHDNAMASPSRIDTAYFNAFNYNEQIHAAYATYGTRIDKFSVQGGLRAEYMVRSWDNTYYNSLSSLQTDRSNYKPRLQLFPSFYMTYTLPKNNELQLNFTRRINRPRGREINPFRNYSDSTNISFGNPDLSPELTSSLEFNYLKSWENHSLSASVFYQFTDDVMQNVRFVNNGVLENTTMNVTKSNNSGLELVAKNKFMKVINLTTSLNAHYNRMHAGSYTSLYNTSLVTITPEQDMFSWDGKIMANLILGKSTAAQITGNYSSPHLIAQGKETAEYSIDLGLRQTFLNRKLSLNLMVRDLLDSQKKTTITSGAGFYQRSENLFHGRLIGLTATYNFGNSKPKQDQKKKTENMDMNMESGGME
ncbi:MAG TPA: outer membrane beta-barrel family protein [Paludibacter sp.]|nr:outer membrane beta-barrel family protein [Paludibacter sp.]